MWVNGALFARAYARWVEDKAQQLAAALAYYSVFSFAPLLLFTAGLAGLVFGEPDVRQRLIGELATVLGSRGAEAVSGMMGDPESATRSGLLTSAIGLIGFLVAAVAVVAQLKEALNTVWDVQAPKQSSWGAWIRKYLANMALVVATGFLLLISLVATAALSAVTERAQRWVALPDGVWWVLDFVLGFVLTTGVFTLIFRVIPDTPVEWRDAAVGGAFTAVLFTAGRLILGLYLGREGGDSIYDAAGSVVALLVWVYYSSQLVLFGAEFTFEYARTRAAALKR